MQTMTLYMRNGDVVLHCTSCQRSFGVDTTTAFVPQLRDISNQHHCYRFPPPDEIDARAALLGKV
ncbi:MAG: hypothetical protein QOE05_732 [Actinomycetota bacterium]|jgi:hypothetical protein|nr:hypothetical protein [Actinomycetota bacterium]